MIQNKLLDEIKEFCQLNKIDDVDSFINKILRNGFNIEKYGNKPSIIKDNIPISLIPKPIAKSNKPINQEINKNIYDE